MSSSKRSKKRSLNRRSSSPKTGMAKAKAGRSGKRSLKPLEIGSHFLTQTETFDRASCLGCFYLRDMLRLWLGRNDQQSYLAGEALSHFQRGYLLSFCSTCKSKRKQVQRSLEETQSINGPQMGFSSMSKSSGKLSAEDSESARYL